jgi:hypothetical protein
MATSALVDAGYLVALLSRRDANHRWAAAQAPRFPPRWLTCEAVLSETLHLLGGRGALSLASLLRRGASDQHPARKRPGCATPFDAWLSSIATTATVTIQSRKPASKDTQSRLTTDQGRIYRADRGTTFSVCKTVSLGMSAPAWRWVIAARHPGWASSSRHGRNARNDSAAPTKQENRRRYQHPLPWMGDETHIPGGPS